VADGFLLVDKQPGWTSHDVVAKARRALGIKKVGHAGTLDPMATGLLILGVGRATRLLRFVQGLAKEYRAEAELGVATSTLDADGEEVAREPVSLTAGDVRAVLAEFTGDIMQTPPMVSAKKTQGRKLYELARAGQEVERDPVRVTVHELEMTEFVPGDFPLVGLRVVCGAGTYIRSLADDIAIRLGTRAHLTSLRRTRIGDHGVEDAVVVDRNTGAELEEHLLPMSAGIAQLPKVEIGTGLATRVAHGQVLDLDQLPVTGPTRIVATSGELLAIYREVNGKAKPELVLA
jgi:tRNA pseudouridine55 synthase